MKPLSEPIDLAVLEKAFRAANWVWGHPGYIPTADEIRKSIADLIRLWERGPKTGKIFAGGLTINAEGLFIDDSIAIHLPNPKTGTAP